MLGLSGEEMAEQGWKKKNKGEKNKKKKANAA